MVLFIRAYLGGILTILSQCIPVLPQSRAERRPGDTRQVGGNEGIGHDLKPVYLVLKGFESRVPGHERGKQFAARRRRDGAQEPDGRQPARLLRTWRKRPRRGRDAEQRDESPSSCVELCRRAPLRSG